MTSDEIREKVEKGQCPSAFSWCTIATTALEKEERIKTCTSCWNSYLAQKGDK